MLLSFTATQAKLVSTKPKQKIAEEKANCENEYSIFAFGYSRSQMLSNNSANEKLTAFILS